MRRGRRRSGECFSVRNKGLWHWGRGEGGRLTSRPKASQSDLQGLLLAADTCMGRDKGGRKEEEVTLLPQTVHVFDFDFSKEGTLSVKQEEEHFCTSFCCLDSS